MSEADALADALANRIRVEIKAADYSVPLACDMLKAAGVRVIGDGFKGKGETPRAALGQLVSERIGDKVVLLWSPRWMQRYRPGKIEFRAILPLAQIPRKVTPEAMLADALRGPVEVEVTSYDSEFLRAPTASGYIAKRFLELGAPVVETKDGSVRAERGKVWCVNSNHGVATWRWEP